MTDTYDTNDHPDDAVVPPDPSVAALLRDVAGEVPFRAVDWGAMHRCIVGDAAPLLLRRQRRPWLTWMAQWSSVAIPCGVAAGVAALLLLAVAPSPQRGGSVSANASGSTSHPSSVTFATAVAGGTSAQTLADGITGTLEGDTLLSRIIHD